jgi:predicted transcriptional regulator
MPKPRPIGDQELEALRFAAEHAPISVGEMARAYGAPRGLARTTVLTVMERLRSKGYLLRHQVDGVFKYAPKHAQGEVMSGLVAEFVERSLGGSLSPFVAYLADTGKLGPKEIEELKRMVERLEAQEKAK